MALNQDLQAKLQEEIDKTVPLDSIAKPSDKYSMPFLEATLMEVHRFGSVVPMGLNHRAIETTTIGPYTIPKG